MSTDELNANQSFENSPELHLTGIDWCSGEDAISFEEQLWFSEYHAIEELIDLH